MAKSKEDLRKLQADLLQAKSDVKAKAGKDAKSAGALIAIQKSLKKVGDALAEFGDYTLKEASFGAHSTSKERKARQLATDQLTSGGMQAVTSTPRVFVGGGKDRDAPDLPSGFMGSTLLVIRHGIEIKGVSTVEMQRSTGVFKKPVQAYNLGDKGMKLIKNKSDVDSWLNDNKDSYIVRFEGRLSDSTGQTVYEKGSQDYEILNATIPLPEGKSEIWVSCDKFQGVMLKDQQYEVINTGLSVAKVGVNRVSGLAGGAISAGLDIEPNMIKELMSALADAAEPAIEPIKQAIEEIKRANEAAKTEILTFEFTPTGGEGFALECGKDKFSYDGHAGLVGRGVKIGDVADKIKAAIPR